MSMNRLSAVAVTTLVLLAGPAQAGPHCRFYSAAEMSALMGRKMEIVIDSAQQCMYGPSKQAIVVSVRESAHEPAQMGSMRGTEKVPGAAGEAYYDADLFGFAARVGRHNVSVQADYRPAPRKELIAIGTRITRALAGQ
jgi:hypothetical protein